MQQIDRILIGSDFKEENKRNEGSLQFFRPPPLRRMNASINVFDSSKRLVTRVVPIRKSFSLKTS